MIQMVAKTFVINENLYILKIDICQYTGVEFIKLVLIGDTGIHIYFVNKSDTKYRNKLNQKKRSMRIWR